MRWAIVRAAKGFYSPETEEEMELEMASLADASPLAGERLAQGIHFRRESEPYRVARRRRAGGPGRQALDPEDAAPCVGQERDAIPPGGGDAKHQGRSRTDAEGRLSCLEDCPVTAGRTREGGARTRTPIH